MTVAAKVVSGCKTAARRFRNTEWIPSSVACSNGRKADRMYVEGASFIVLRVASLVLINQSDDKNCQSVSPRLVN